MKRLGVHPDGRYRMARARPAPAHAPAPASALGMLMADVEAELAELDAEWKEEITAVESPQALAREPIAPKRSGTYMTHTSHEVANLKRQCLK